MRLDSAVAPNEPVEANQGWTLRPPGRFWQIKLRRLPRRPRERINQLAETRAQIQAQIDALAILQSADQTSIWEITGSRILARQVIAIP